MKVKCQYCDTVFNMEENQKCPECGAPISKEDVESYKKIKYREKIIDIEEAEFQLIKDKENFIKNKNAHKEKKKKERKDRIMIIIIYIIIGFVVLAGATINAFFQFLGDEIDKIEESQKQEILIDEDTVVGFNEKAQMAKYSIICDNFEEWEYDVDDFTKPSAQPKANQKYVRFHFVIENNHNVQIYTEDFVASVDGYECSDVYRLTEEAKTSQIRKHYEIKSGLKYSGYIYKEIPNDAKEVKIQYGKYLTINVPMS